MNTLEVWGFPLGFRNASSDMMASIESEFSGAFFPTDDDPHHTFTLAGDLTFPTGDIGQLIARHRGGSSGDKKLLDGTIFPAASQNRDVRVVGENAQVGIYTSNGSVVVTCASQTVVAGNVKDAHLVPDLVEAYLLHRARQLGWMQCHAAGWVIDGCAQLAIGDSGDGKTTRLLGGLKNERGSGLQATFLGNDRVFLRIHEDTLQVRGYPLAMNIGCGTIRSLKLDLPQFGGADDTKIRLLPPDVARLFNIDYENWWQVDRILCKDEQTLKANLYSLPDPCHPTWNASWATPLDRALALRIESRAAALTDFSPLLNKWGLPS